MAETFAAFPDSDPLSRIRPGGLQLEMPSRRSCLTDVVYLFQNLMVQRSSAEYVGTKPPGFIMASIPVKAAR